MAQLRTAAFVILSEHVLIGGAMRVSLQGGGAMRVSLRGVSDVVPDGPGFWNGALQGLGAPRIEALKYTHGQRHAPRLVFSLSGFRNQNLNGEYEEHPHEDVSIAGQTTYWSTSGDYLVYWCEPKQSWALGPRTTLQPESKALIKFNLDQDCEDANALGASLGIGELWNESTYYQVLQFQARRDCGYPGITQDQCNEKGCVYEETQIPAPWCFHPYVWEHHGAKISESAMVSDPLHVLTMRGFQEWMLNGPYVEKRSEEFRVNDRETYWSPRGGGYFMYLNNFRWLIVGAKSFRAVKNQTYTYIAEQVKDNNCDILSPCLEDQQTKSDSATFGGPWSHTAEHGEERSSHAGVYSIGMACGAFPEEASCPTSGCEWDIWHERCTASWKMVGVGGPNHEDIGQGLVGDCYFLAALSAIAWTHPDVIMGMFVAGMSPYSGKTKHMVTVTKWLLHGKPTNIAVDAMVPVGISGKPVFVRYTATHVFWPLVLEKAWAKIFGSYEAIPAGHAPEALRAMTSAPVEILRHLSHKKTQIWERLQFALDSNFPVTAGTGSSTKHGIASSHAFVVLKLIERPSSNGRQVSWVQLYNVHGRSKYEGKLVHDKAAQDLVKGHPGQFVMTFDEFFDDMQLTDFAHVRTDYKLTSEVVSRDASKTTKYFKLKMEQDRDFAVQVDWPSNRLVTKAGCQTLRPKIKVLVFLKTRKWPTEQYQKVATAVPVGDMLKGGPLSHVQADVKGKAGSYIVHIEAEFPSGDWVNEIVLSTYAAERPQINEVNRPSSLLHLGLAHVREHVPSMECSRLVDRLKDLDNAPQILKARSDPLFRPEQESVGRMDKLKDTAQNIDVDVVHGWSSFSDMMVEARTGVIA